MLTTRETELRSSFFMAGVIALKLKRLMNPLKVSVISVMRLLVIIDSVNTRMNFTFLSLSNRIDKK